MSEARWTEATVAKLRYESQHDPGERGNYYRWEGGTGFGIRLYRSGRRKWVCGTSVTDRSTGKARARFFTLGESPAMSLKQARVAASLKLNMMRSGVDPRATENQDSKAIRALLGTTLKEAMEFYIANRNCAPISKSDLRSSLQNCSDWMDKPLLEVDSVMLQQRYASVMERVRQRGQKQDAKYALLAEKDRLLVAPPGYFNGIKSALDMVKSFSRVFRYWVKIHQNRLRKAGIVLPECPTAALGDDLQPEPQRVKSIPIPELKRLIESYPTYCGSALHPLLARLLLATGRRVGCLMAIKREYIREDRIVIPPDGERTKVRWRKRHLSHMAQVIPITPEIKEILEELKQVGPFYGDAETWLFPSREAKSGHMVEERAVAVGLRKHSGVRFTCHQFRHNVATAAEELGYSKSEIRELLGQGTETVTDRYIDERVNRQRGQLMAIRAKLDELMARCE